MKKTFRLFILTLGLTLCLTVNAIESTWYEVEVLLFEQSDVNRLNSEKWDQNISLVDTKESQDFITIAPSLVHLEQICLNGDFLEVKEMLPFSIVEETSNKAEVSELGPNQTEQVAALDVDDLKAQIRAEKPFQILSKDLNQLNNLETTLRRSRGFRSLMHITWRQPIDSKKDSKLIRLYTGKNYSDTFNPQGDARVDIASYIPEVTDAEDALDNSKDVSLNSIDPNEPLADFSLEKNLFQGVYAENTLEVVDPVQAEQLKRKQQLNKCRQLQQDINDNNVQDVWQLDGNIKLYVERYLHLETDLMLRLPGKVDIQLGAIETSLAADKLLHNLDSNLGDNQSTDDGFGWQLGDNFLVEDQNTSVIQQDVLNKYSIQQSRRMKSNEVHYIDHPLFGILIEIRSYDKDAVNDQDNNQTDSGN